MFRPCFLLVVVGLLAACDPLCDVEVPHVVQVENTTDAEVTLDLRRDAETFSLTIPAKELVTSERERKKIEVLCGDHIDRTLILRVDVSQASLATVSVCETDDGAVSRPYTVVPLGGECPDGMKRIEQGFE